jgi:hypothetical protein
LVKWSFLGQNGAKDAFSAPSNRRSTRPVRSRRCSRASDRCPVGRAPGTADSPGLQKCAFPLNFSCVRPEPVLVNIEFLGYSGAKKTIRTGAGGRAGAGRGIVEPLVVIVHPRNRVARPGRTLWPGPGVDEYVLDLQPAQRYSFLVFSLCLSRACLGKMIIYIHI